MSTSKSVSETGTTGKLHCLLYPAQLALRAAVHHGVITVTAFISTALSRSVKPAQRDRCPVCIIGLVYSNTIVIKMVQCLRCVCVKTIKALSRLIGMQMKRGFDSRRNIIEMFKM